jgi:hypothetical protein
VGAVAHEDVLRSIERFGTEVAPVVRAEVERRGAVRRPPELRGVPARERRPAA